MTGRKNYGSALFVPLIFLCACSNTKHLPANDALYTGAKVTVKGASSARQKKVLTADLSGLTRPKPNSKILGVRLKLSIYNLFWNKKPKSFFGKLRDKFAEPPVLLSQVDLPKNVQILQNHLENKGYFRAQVSGDTVVNRKRKMAHANYTADVGAQYTIDSLAFPNDSSALAHYIQECKNKSLLKLNKPFDLDVIKAERSRIDAYLKENGFYFFNPDYLLIQADSTVGGHHVAMNVIVKPETPDEARRIYYINNTYIYANYNLRSTRQDTSKANARFYDGYFVIDPKHNFKPKLFEQAMQFEHGEPYNRTDHNATLSRLISLDVFRFVKNRFEVVPGAIDTPKLNAYYYVTPQPKKSLTGEIDLTQRSNNANGSQITFTWRDRNTFHGGEHLSISGYVGSELQYNTALQGFNTFRMGGQINLSVPRFEVPFFQINTSGGYIPRTNIQLGYDILNRSKLYTLNSYRFSYGFQWKENVMINHELDPISLVYVQPLNVTKLYKDSIRNNPFLQHAIEQQFILGSSYQYTFNQPASGLKLRNMYYFNGLVDLSGNIAGLVTGANAKQGKRVYIDSVPFSQYVKLEADGRYYRQVGLNNTWASRLDIGFGLPYGNSTQLPYIKQFFAGGNNDLRGFRSRSVGPGTYHYPDTTGFYPDQTGDIKFLVSTEYRQKISGPLYSAFFVDAGNVWLKNANPEQPGSGFSGKFLSQLAVDAGVGLRVDIQLFVIRLDVAFPVRKPWLDNPWVLNQIRLYEQKWRRENVIFNLAIGYPF